MVWVAKERGVRLYIGAVSNLNDRGFSFLRDLPWPAYPREVCCSVHRYPDGHSPLNPQRGSRSRDEEIQKVREIVGDRPIALTEMGYHNAPGGWTEQESAENEAWERRFGDRHGFDFVVKFQLNDGPDPSNTSTEAHYGARRADGTWKPAADAFIGAL